MNRWHSFQTDNPREKENILLARRIIHKLHTTDRELSENEKDNYYFAQILKQIEVRQKSRNRRIVTDFLKYPQLPFSFTIGALLFYQKSSFNPQFYAQEVSEPTQTDEAVLIRSGRENIMLSEAKSKIEHRTDGQVVVNDKIIEPSGSQHKGTPEMNQLVIPYGKTSEITLPDGTHVFLNAGSRLIYPDFFADKSREVFLAGEAFFDVKQDEKQPFVVQTTDIRVRVLGTQFNISAYPSENIIETMLTSGKIRLEQNNSGIFSETTELSPGQLAAFNKTEHTTRLEGWIMNIIPFGKRVYSNLKALT